MTSKVFRGLNEKSPLKSSFLSLAKYIGIVVYFMTIEVMITDYTDV